MKTSKIIDLLNKLANGEKVPKKIIGKNSMGKKEEYIYNNFWYIHIFENPDREEDYYYMNRDIKDLNDEVEILEEEKKIPEKINLYEETQNIIRENNYKLVYHDIHKCIVSLECKYNQLIDYLKSKETGE